MGVAHVNSHTMRAHEFIPHDQLLETQLTPDQVRTRQRAWLWSELQNLLLTARKAALPARAKPKIIKWKWKKPAKPRKPKIVQPRRRKRRTGAMAPIKPQVLADPARAQRRLASLQRR
jgi:hypothetical protein